MVMKFYQYKDTGIDMPSNRLPNTYNLFIENAAGHFYSAPAAVGYIYKSENKGETHTQVVYHAGKTISSFWHDRTNNYLYFIEWDESPDEISIYYIDMDNDNVYQVGSSINPTGGWSSSPLGMDVFLYSGSVYCCINYTTPVATVYTKFYKYTTSWGEIGTESARQFMGRVCIVSDKAYYLNGGQGSNSKMRAFSLTSETFVLDYNIDSSSYIFTGIGGIAYDGVNDLVFHISQEASVAGSEMWRYSISGGTAWKIGDQALYIMQNRDTAAGVFEKAFAYNIYTTQKEVYQLSDKAVNLRKIASFVGVYSGAINAISDNYCIMGVNVMEWKDMSAFVIDFPDHSHKERNFYTFEFQARKEIADLLTKDIFVQILDTYTGQGSSTADQIVMEGTIIKRDQWDDAYFWVVNEGEELFRIKPILTDDFNDAYIATNYNSKTSDELITQLLSDYSRYCSAGTIPTGSITWAYPTDIIFAGRKSLAQIFNMICDAEGWTWKMRPSGEIDANDGTTASGASLASTDHILMALGHETSQRINQAIVHGAYKNGEKIGPATANGASQSEHGIFRWEKTYGNIFEIARLQSIADNKITVIGEVPLIFELQIRKTSISFIQPGETVSIGAGIRYDNSTRTLTAGTYILNEIKYNPKDQETYLVLTDGMLFEDDEAFTLPEENAERLDEVRESTFNKAADGEINALTLKTTPVDADVIVIEDSVASFAKKKITIAGLEAGISHTDPNAYHDNVADEITATAAKITVADADEFLMEDSEASFVKKAITFANLKAGIGGFTPPIGFIAMYSGTWVDNSTIPGWYKCDGNNGTVNLVNKFVRGAATSGGSGGSDDAIVVSHKHEVATIPSGSGYSAIQKLTGTLSIIKIDTEYEGVSGTSKNIPAYYALIFIQRIS